ncbi:MAG TPA: hypothetical protein VLA34_12850, partial [Candidatus Krumholzibacterium sp.]|nr:hypothetical protein [Candidatus Krumholzibacterium sp.]
AAVLPQGNEVFPAIVKYDVLPDEVPPPYLDIGEECYAYRDYCVSAIDKITGQTLPGLPFTRLVELDAMDHAYRERTDPYIESTPGFPERLELWSEITMPGRFFDPDVTGFTYVEIYDPEYWVRYNGIETQDCIRPIFRMKTRASRSCLNDCIIAFWTTRFENVVPPVESSTGAPNVQFGIPLWFFNRDQADSIADAIFERWGIK